MHGLLSSLPQCTKWNSTFELHHAVQANVGDYDASARYYVRALSLNPRAVNVWGYLRTSLACSGKLELMPAVDEEDLALLQAELPIG